MKTNPTTTLFLRNRHTQHNLTEPVQMTLTETPEGTQAIAFVCGDIREEFGVEFISHQWLVLVDRIPCLGIYQSSYVQIEIRKKARITSTFPLRLTRFATPYKSGPKTTRILDLSEENTLYIPLS
jgi:hypothetical protein